MHILEESRSQWALCQGNYLCKYCFHASFLALFLNTVRAIVTTVKIFKD